MSRPRYPSDHRRWFRVMEDILDDPKLQSLSPPDRWQWLELLATANRVGAHRPLKHPAVAPGTVDTFFLPWRSALSALAAQNRRAACARAARLARAGLARFARVDGGLLCSIPKWSENQGMAPAQLRRDSGETPATTPTPTHTPTRERERERRAPPSATRAPEEFSPEEVERIRTMLDRRAPWLLDPRVLTDPPDHCSESWVLERVQKCLDWAANARGSKAVKSDWPRAAVNWVLNDDEREWQRLKRPRPDPRLVHNVRAMEREQRDRRPTGEDVESLFGVAGRAQG